MNTYTITLKRKLWFDRKLKRVKGNHFPDDLNPGYDEFKQINPQSGKPVSVRMRRQPAKYMAVIFEDERQLIVNLDKFECYEISKELFILKAKQAEQESQGQARFTT